MPRVDGIGPFAALVWIALAQVAGVPTSQAQMGYLIHGVGPVNLSMGGAGTAVPLEALGALHWNPALLTALPASETSLGLVLLRDAAELSSRVGSRSGTTQSAIDPTVLPNFAMVNRPSEDSPWAWGLGAFAVSGVASDYQPDGRNPILAQPPNGFGPIAADYKVLQVAPSLAYRFDDTWSVGFAPTFSYASLQLMPFTAAAPDPGTGGYLSGLRGDSSWGFGFQFGVGWHKAPWRLGLSYKSEQWFGKFRINAVDSASTPRKLAIEAELPAIISAGLGHTLGAYEIAFDLRYVDFRNASIVGDPARFDSNYAVTGFGLRGIWVWALGAQYQASEQLSLRAGYTYAQNPIRGLSVAHFAIAPAIIEHSLGLGLSWKTIDRWKLSVSLHRGLDNAVTGQIPTPNGPVPDASVTSRNAITTLGFGMAREF